MEKFLVFLILLFFQFLQSQEMKTHTLLPPESKEHSDLQFLREELKGKRLVMLGEMTHMYGNIFETKARVVEYMHKELGYSTIAFESSMYDIWLMNSQNPEVLPEALNEAVFGVWAKTLEFQRLVNYIAENDLKVIGFDSQIIKNVPEFIDDFFTFCREQNIEIRLDEDDMGIAVEDVLEEGIYTEDDIKFRNFEQELTRIIGRIQTLEQTDFNNHWLQFAKSLRASSRDAFYREKIPYNSDRANKNHNFRDKQMADNLLSYLQRNPEEKVIAWADNIHIINDMSSVKDPVLREFIPMGSHIKKTLGDEVYSLATIHANDSLLEGKVWHQTPVLKGSFEDGLASLNQPYIFVSSSQGAVKKSQQQRLLNFVHFSEARPDQLHDGYIFLRRAIFPKKKETSGKITAGTAAATPVYSPGEGDRTSRFEGRIVDAETKEPIPFVSIFLKDHGIYRISDDDGRFQLKIPQGIPDDAFVEISALGYDSRDISLKAVEGAIALVPSFEQLDEVILTAYGTTPKKVLRRAIKEIETNHPTTPFNYKRYGRAILVVNDTIHRDVEMVTKEFYQGYRQKYFPEQKLEQVKWNHQSERVEPEKYSARLGTFRENPIQFSSVLHKRKYRKFDLEFIMSTKAENEGLYVIKFSTNKTRFSFTNYWFPTAYSGEIYINKEDFAVVKVVEKWESTLAEKDMEEYKYWHGEYKGELKWTQDRISVFTKQPDGKYYASKFFDRSYREKHDLQGTFLNTIYERTFRLYNYDFEKVEVLERDDWKKNTALDRVKYDPVFWKKFGQEKDVFR